MIKKSNLKLRNKTILKNNFFRKFILMIIYLDYIIIINILQYMVIKNYFFNLLNNFHILKRNNI